MKLTEEQEAIVEASKTSSSLVVNALAGTGKTSTALECAKANRGSRIGYFCFNRANASEMREKVAKMGIRNVFPSTLHALAWRHVAKPMTDSGRELGSFRPYDIRDLVVFKYAKNIAKDARITDSRILNRAGRLLLDHLSAFCHSDAASFKEFKAQEKHKLTEWQIERIGIDREFFDDETEKLWNLILETPSLKIPHDVYLKLFHLNMDRYMRSINYDIIIIDEAQDLFPVTEDIVCKFRDRGCRVIFLGDRFQQIYSWNKSVNAMEHFEEGSDILSLTQSFRCPQNVVDLAEPWLKLLGFTGKYRAAQPGVEDKGSVIVSRTNSGIFKAVSDFRNAGMKPSDICLVGGAEGYSFDMLSDRLNFMRGRFSDIRFPGMALLRDDKEYDDYAKVTKDQEMSQAKQFINDIGPKQTEAFLDDVRHDRFSRDAKSAKVCISTGHKIKGLEFSRVAIMPTFIDILEEYRVHLLKQGIDLKPSKSQSMFADDRDLSGQELDALGKSGMKFDAEEARLAYVALTRSLSDIVPGPLSLAEGRFEIVKKLCEKGDIILTDKDKYGNVVIFGEKKERRPAPKPKPETTPIRRPARGMRVSTGP